MYMVHFQNSSIWLQFIHISGLYFFLPNPTRQMPCQLDFNSNVIQIIGGHFYICKFTPFVEARLLWVPLEPETNNYFNQMCLVHSFYCNSSNIWYFHCKNCYKYYFSLKTTCVWYLGQVKHVISISR